MILIPAIDLYEKKVVRLTKGDYNRMEVYSADPVATAKEIEKAGAKYIHLVDLEGAKNGTTPNADIVERIASETSLSVEIGGGIRSRESAERYISAGVKKVILGTAAVENEEFLKEMLSEFGERIAVGVDARGGRVAVRGWLEESEKEVFGFIAHLRDIGVKSAIVTDISKDGAMSGTNHALYKELLKTDGIDVTASGGVSSYEDIIKLRDAGVHSAIIGKALYEGKVDLKRALSVSEGKE